MGRTAGDQFFPKIGASATRATVSSDPDNPRQSATIGTQEVNVFADWRSIWGRFAARTKPQSEYSPRRGWRSIISRRFLIANTYIDLLIGPAARDRQKQPLRLRALDLFSGSEGRPLELSQAESNTLAMSQIVLLKRSCSWRTINIVDGRAGGARKRWTVLRSRIPVGVPSTLLGGA
jgi:hypothetical protein